MTGSSLPPLNALRAFEAAARLGGMSRAAAELHVTHGAVSRQVRQLEDWIGTPLFEREGRGLRPTPAGRRLQEASAAAFGQLRQAARELRRGLAAQTLVLGCPGSLLARWLIPRLGRLSADLPGIGLHLSAVDDGFAPSLPGLDAALLIDAPPWPAGWRVRPLARERTGPVLSPRHPRFDALARLAPKGLLAEPLLHTASRPQAWPDWLQRQGLDPSRLRAGSGFDHLYYLLEAAVAGLGIAIAPEQLVADDIASARLAAPWGFVDTDASWCLCWREDHADPRLERLADWLSQQLD